MKVSDIALWEFGKQNHGSIVESGLNECLAIRRKEREEVVIICEDA